VKGHKENEIKAALATNLSKIMSWCAYQERSHQEVRTKLKQLSVDEEESEGLIARLIAENYLNEERFAMAYAGGKFRIKQWGRNKIKAGLRQQRVSENNIRKALLSLEEEDYLKAVRLLAIKKLETLSTIDRRKKYQSVFSYLIQRGFESELVESTLSGLIGTTNNYEFRT
jgi:regulatory protein